jgi:hypothetical protein
MKTGALRKAIGIAIVVLAPACASDASTTNSDAKDSDSGYPYVYAGHTFSCEALPAGDTNGCALPTPACAGYDGVPVDATTAGIRFPELCSVVVGPVHPYYPNDPATQYCSSVTLDDVKQWEWACPM